MGKYRLDVNGTSSVESSGLTGDYTPVDCDCGGAPARLEPSN